MKFELNTDIMYEVTSMTYKIQTNGDYVYVDSITKLLTLEQVISMIPKHKFNILESGSITIHNKHHIEIDYINEETGIRVISHVHELINE